MPQTKNKAIMNEIQQTALRLMARREHSCFELKQKLLRREFPCDQIEMIIQQLIAKKLLCDARFTESYCRYRSEKGYGPQRINMELSQRGVESELIAEQLAAMQAGWLALAQRVRQKRFGSKLPSSFAEQAKQMRFLQYRGFTAEQINKVFKQEKD